MKRSRVLLPVAALLLASCISLPASQADLRASASSRMSFEVESRLEDAYRIVAENTARCEDIAMERDRLAMAGTLAASGSKYIAGEFDEARGKAAVSVHFQNMAATGFLQLIDLERIDPTTTRITQHRLNESAKWKGAGEALRGWFAGRTDCNREA